MKNSPPIGTLWSPIGYLRKKEIEEEKEEEKETDTERASAQTTRARARVRAVTHGDLNSFSDIIKKRIKTEKNRPKPNLTDQKQTKAN